MFDLSSNCVEEKNVSICRKFAVLGCHTSYYDALVLNVVHSIVMH